MIRSWLSFWQEKKTAGKDEQNWMRSFSLFKDEIEQNKRKYDELKARHVECENKIKKINEGMIKTKERLLEVKNNKEYQAMLKEIEIAEIIARRC